ncbi:MAG: hypothetical protein INR69_14905 [Mucilaginibacter polytrichastri]|nr:hypothetical protein [Mucilaginibacter polytrichastri]
MADSSNILTQDIGNGVTAIWINGSSGQSRVYQLTVPANYTGILLSELDDTGTTLSQTILPKDGTSALSFTVTEKPKYYTYYTSTTPPVEPPQPLPASMNKLSRVPQL